MESRHWRLLGDLKDEYPHKELIQYVGLGAKNYAIRFADGTSECKVRGFTLNYQTSKLIDFDTMVEMLREGVGNKTVVTTHPNAIVRGGQVGVGAMYTRPQENHTEWFTTSVEYCRTASARYPWDGGMITFESVYINDGGGGSRTL